jgi:hypothetical protein
MKVLVLIYTSITARCTSGDALYGGTDVPRPRVKRSTTCGRNRFLSTSSRTVHVYAEAAAFAKQHLDLTPREEPRQEGEILGFDLGSTYHPRRLQTA